MRLMGLIYLAAELKKDHASVPFLENQKIEPNCKKFIMMAYFWAHGVSGATQVSMIDFGEKSVIQWNHSIAAYKGIIFYISKE